MKTFSVALAAAVLISPLVANTVSAQSKGKQKPLAAQAAQASYEDAWRDCQASYAGARGALGRDRYALIEGCFKQKTGKFPGEVGMNCNLRRC